MRMNSGSITRFLLGALVVALPIAALAQAPPPRTPNETTRGEKARGGTDPNVKQDRAGAVAGDKITVQPPPQKAAKADEKARQIRVCAVMVDNWTGYAIDVFVDGTYRGTMPPWGELYAYAVSGPTLMYGRSAGGTTTWGPRTVQCNASYVWRLDP